MDLTQCLLAAVSALTGAVVFQFVWFQRLFADVKKRAEDCEADRLSILRHCAACTEHRPNLAG